MNREATLGERLQALVAKCTFINADPENRFSQKIKDDILTSTNKLLDTVISQTDPHHIDVVTLEALEKRVNKKMDDMRKENLERLKKQWMNLELGMKI